jgi:hypothetical protein
MALERRGNLRAANLVRSNIHKCAVRVYQASALAPAGLRRLCGFVCSARVTDAGTSAFVDVRRLAADRPLHVGLPSLGRGAIERRPPQMGKRLHASKAARQSSRPRVTLGSTAVARASTLRSLCDGLPARTLRLKDPSDSALFAVHVKKRTQKFGCLP